MKKWVRRPLKIYPLIRFKQTQETAPVTVCFLLGFFCIYNSLRPFGNFESVKCLHKAVFRKLG